MDNLGTHKGAAIRNALQEAGASLWFPPPYSPDLNPIEQTFAKIKHRMRLAQTRSQQDTWRHVGQPSTRSHPENAPITSETPDMLLNKRERV